MNCGIYNFNISNFRLFRSKKFSNKNFMKNKQKFVDNDDLVGERDLILEYITEGIEITYTLYLMFILLSYFSFAMSFIIFHNKIMFIIPLAISLIFRYISMKKKESLLFETVGYGLAESIYNNDIIKKYNM